jgi:hypothetical protein
VAEPIPLAELELRIALLPPVSRGAHLGGPTIHARRLVQLWRGGEMTADEIGQASNDELIDRYTVIDNGAEAKAVYAELWARYRARSKPIMEEVGDREDDLERAWMRLRSIKSSPGEDVMTIDAVKDCLREIELATLKEPSPKTPRPSDRADHWGDDDVPLSQAFRLLGVEEIARAIFRTALMSDHDYPNDPVHWPLPPLSHLLSELHDAVWQALLDGELRIEAIPYERGKLGEALCVVPPIELERLRPDWELSRLCRGDRDEYVRARVRRTPVTPAVEPVPEPVPVEPVPESAPEPPAEPVPEPSVESPVEPSVELPTELAVEPADEIPAEPPKRQHPTKAQLRTAMEEIAQDYKGGGRDYKEGAGPPLFRDIEAKLRIRFPGIAQGEAREALDYQPQLRRERGRPSLRKPLS